MGVQTQIGAVRDPRDLVREYDEKLAKINAVYDAFIEQKAAVDLACTVAGSFGRGNIWWSEPRLDKRHMEANLLRSAWWAAYDWCNMKILATAADKQRIEQDFENPVPFTVENLVATFGPYLADQRGVILRGLAEAFITLDDAYKSHSKVKVGVKGLPKRVIIQNASSEWGRAWGWEKVSDMLNALKVFDGDGLVPSDIMRDIQDKKLLKYRGMEFRWFKNQSVHIHFDQHACLQINRGLAEYYGEVLPDVEPNKDDLKADPKASQVSKDLQYYPTPKSVAERIIHDVHWSSVSRVLEPSCGCGRILDAITQAAKRRQRELSPPPMPRIDGIEYHAGRASDARKKGHSVVCANFLERIPTPVYDLIVMNPPFYGRHYLKHIEHAMKFLAPGGELISILPATAHYDHKALPKGYSWRDLPVGSFAESGTRVPTGFATIRAPR